MILEKSIRKGKLRSSLNKLRKQTYIKSIEKKCFRELFRKRSSSNNGSEYYRLRKLFWFRLSSS